MKLLSDRLKSFLRGPGSSAEAAPGWPTAAVRLCRPEPERGEVSETRQSRGLDQFFGSFRDQAGLSILDLGGAHQENINFITSLGHKFYSEDFLRIFEESFGEDIADQSNPGRIDYFLRRSLDYPDEHFDGVLAWDALEYMEPALLSGHGRPTVPRSETQGLPAGHLSFRGPQADRALLTRFRIQDLRTLQVSRQGERAALAAIIQ